MAVTKLTLIQKEAKTLKFTITDADGVAVDASLATLEFYLKQNDDSDPEYTRLDASFDKTDAATGIVKLPLSTTEMDYVGIYSGLLKVTFSASNIDKNYFLIDFQESDE